MRTFAMLAVCAIMAAGCAKRQTLSEKEEARRAKMELQSVMEMVRTRQVPPIEFEFASAKLLPSSFTLLDQIASVMLRHGQLKLIVEGHTDDVGDDEYNQDLSLRRASSVKQYLAEKGVYASYIRAYGYGESRPAVEGVTDAARALNRRVEFKITTRDWNSVY